MNSKSDSDLYRLWRILSRTRRIHLALLVALMFIGALAELVTLGAVLPFLTLMAEPERAYSYPVLASVAQVLGWTKPNDLLLPATLLFVLLAITAGAIRVALTWATSKVVFGVGYDLSLEAYRRQLYQPYSYHVARNTSDIVAVGSKVQLVTQGFMLPAMQAAVAAVIATAILLGLILIDPVVAGVAGLGFSAVYISISLLVRLRLRANSQTIARKQSSRVQAVQESLGSIRDVLLDGTQNVYLKRLATEERPFHAALAANTIIGSMPRYLLESIGMVLIASLAYAITLREGGLGTALPILGALALGGQKLIPLMQQVYLGWAKMSGNRRSLGDLLELAEQPICGTSLQAQDAPRCEFRRQLQLRQVSFKYSDDAPTSLSAIDLTIRRGERVGFIGTTGSGKSTLIDVVMGLLPPTEGCVEVDGRVLDDASRSAWQRHIAHVPQAIFLSDASIAENIALGCSPETIDPQRLRRAARYAQILTFVEDLPRGFGTPVGERGVRLSGGQRQRIGIARALYKQTDVLVLDEATSALDDETERQVMNALSSLGDELTVLIVAHRLTTLSNCDFIVKLECGRILDQGPPAKFLPSMMQTKTL